LSDQEKKEARVKVNFQASIIRDQLQGTETEQRKLANLALEVKLLRYGDSNLVQQYRDIRKCLEYEY
jgi:hypothetical protein